MTNVRELWSARLEERLPPRSDILARNAAITATYAEWYLRAPALCKWSGMAVNASYEVGNYLRQLMTSGSSLARLLPRHVADAQVELIRAANNAVFDDIGWVHGAFLDPRGGLAAVEEILANRPTHHVLLEGFRTLDAGRRLLDADPMPARDLVWEGTRKLLLHEQRFAVQPRFAAYHPAFAFFLSLAARSDFRFAQADIDQRTIPAFVPFMLRQGRAVLRSTGTIRPDISRFDHRWSWLEGEVLPCFREVEEMRQPAFRACIARLTVQKKTSSMGQTDDRLATNG